MTRLLDVPMTAFLFAALVISLVAIGLADCQDQRRCQEGGGRVQMIKHGWECKR